MMKHEPSANEQATPAAVTAETVAAFLKSEAERLSAIHGVFVNHISTSYTASCIGSGLSYAVHAQGECEFGSSPDDAMKRLLPRIDNPAKLAASKREQAARLIEEADSLSKTLNA